MLGYFFHMLYAPGAAIDRVLAEQPSFKRITAYVSAMGLLRGLVEGLWILLMAGQLQAMLVRGQFGTWILGEAAPFLLANLLTGLFRWGLFAIVPYALGRFSGGQGRWLDFLRVYGVAMAIYVVTILPNYSYLFWHLPVYQVAVSWSYNPIFGLGQVLTSIWLGYFGYVSCRRLHGLPGVESVLVGVAVPATNLGLFIIAAKVFFNLRLLARLSLVHTFWIATAGFIAAALVAIPVLFWLGFRHARSERSSIPDITTKAEG